MTLATHPGVDLTKPIDLVVDDRLHGPLTLGRILPLDQAAPGATTIPVTLHAEPLPCQASGREDEGRLVRRRFRRLRGRLRRGAVSLHKAQ